MKKNKKEDNNCDYCQGIGKMFEKLNQQIKTKTESAKQYVKENPKQSKMIAAGIGAFFLAVVAFLICKKKK